MRRRVSSRFRNGKRRICAPDECSPPGWQTRRTGSGNQYLKAGDASTIDVVEGIRKILPRVAQTLPPELKIQPLSDQSIFVRGAINGVIREAVIAATLTGMMILIFLGSWRSTVIIAISIPLSILTSVVVLSFLHETINIMPLGGLALAVGILVDDATVTIENIERHFEDGAELHDGILAGAGQIAIPALVSTLCKRGALHRTAALKKKPWPCFHQRALQVNDTLHGAIQADRLSAANTVIERK